MEKIADAFGTDVRDDFRQALTTIDPTLPYTLVHAKDKRVIALQGTLTPDLLRHLATLRAAVTLPDSSGASVKVNGMMMGRNSRGVRIAGVRMDLEVYVQQLTLIAYRARSAQPQDRLAQRSRQDLRDTESERGRRGFAREMEKKRSLMMR